jgi:hypothetical protein
MKKFFGYVIISSIFIGIFILHMMVHGFLVTLVSFGLCALLIAIIALGVYLVMSGNDKKTDDSTGKTHQQFDNP